MSPPRVALAALLLSGCGRGCAERETPPEPRVARSHGSDDVPVAPPPQRSARCVREVTAAAVSIPAGSGPLDAFVPVCAHGTLALYVVRGHILSRVERATDPGAPFGPVEVLSTGVDRLGPVAPEALDGPLAWRSPTAGLDEVERDDVWAAVRAAGDAGARVLRGDALLPAGVEGLGAPVAWRAQGDAVTVLAGVGRRDAPPSVSRVTVRVGSDRPSQPAELPTLVEGELHAFEASRGVALSRVAGPGEPAWVLTWLDGMRASRVPARAPFGLVVGRGVSVDGRSAFVMGEFALGNPDAGPCVRMGGDLCVVPAGLSVLLARGPDEAPVRLAIGDGALPDSVAARGHELTVLYVSAGASGTAQRAARVDVRDGSVTPLVFAPPEGFGAIDGPAVVNCDDGVWMAAEIALERADEAGDPSRAAPRRAVTALPMECLVR